jgi:uncharacterized protein (TIGR00645 family)
MERTLEKMLYAGRWLLAPIFLAMNLALLALGVKFFMETWHLLTHMFSMPETDLVLVILSLIDMALVGGLIVMVMISGYENSVSQLELEEGTEKLRWLGKLDASSLKNKVAASIVAISSIHLLKVFMNAGGIENDKIKWYVILHMTFVISAFIMASIDKLGKSGTDHH